MTGKEASLLPEAEALWEKLSPGEKTNLLVGFSGGADSTALLHFLTMHVPREKITAVHVNHKIRGEEALRDEALARKSAGEMGVAFLLKTVDVPALAREKKLSLETAAREARYEAFREAARETRATILVLAHHADDQAETFFWNLLRGSGLRGLRGMEPRRESNGLTILRPFLTTEKAALLEYIRSYRLTYCEDSTNAQDDAMRNRIRHRVLPTLRELVPSAVNHISRTALEIGADEAYLTGLAREELEKRREGKEKLRAEELNRLPEPIRRRLLLLWLEDNHVPVTESNLLAIEKLSAIGANPSGRLSVGNSMEICREYTSLLVRKLQREKDAPDYEMKLPLPLKEGRTIPFLLPDGGRIEITRSFYAGKEMHSPFRLLLKDRGQREVTVRSRHPGDKLWLPCGHVSVKKRMTDLKIPASQRNRLPVLCHRTDGEIAGVFLLGTALPFRAEKQGDPVFLIEWYPGEEKTGESN